MRELPQDLMAQLLYEKCQRLETELAIVSTFPGRQESRAIKERYKLVEGDKEVADHLRRTTGYLSKDALKEFKSEHPNGLPGKEVKAIEVKAIEGSEDPIGDEVVVVQEVTGDEHY